ncbi:WD40 repeat-like protein [Ceratobasidium sp. AG-Ba]|nr:WD40 repeat-like protein [Ceratobasidium sp. AG-Ba]
MKRQKWVLEKLGPVRGVIDAILGVGGAVAELDPRAKVVFGLVNQAWKKLKDQGKCDASVHELVQGLLELLPAAEAVKKAARLPQLQDTIKEIWGLIENASQFAIEYNSTGKTVSVLRILGASNAQEKVDEMLAKLKQLKETFDRGISIQTFQTLEEITRMTLLAKLKPLSRAHFDAARVCLRGTRTKVIQDIVDWAATSPVSGGFIAKEKIMWMYGQAGLGKSSIATSVCKELDNRRLLTSSFFCKRDDAERRNCQRMLSTIIFGLAIRYPAYAVALQKTLEEDPILPGSPMQNQFDKLVEVIFGSSGLPACETDHVVVVDAFDECASKNDRKQMLTYLFRVSSLITRLKIIITSRPDADIAEFFAKVDRSALRTYDVHSCEASDDILLFVEEHLLPADGAALLAEKSSGLFIWAHTACDFVLSGPKPAAALQSILVNAAAKDSSRALDDLYNIAINASIFQEGRANQSIETVRKCLGAIILCSTRTPLSIDALSELYGDWIDKHEMLWVVKRLGSVLYLDHTQGEAVRVYHTSFVDYIVDAERSKGYCMDISEHNIHVAGRCLKILRSGLRFNVCGLETSFKRNCEVGDLPSRLARIFKPCLEYSCKYWASHITSCERGREKALAKPLKEFLYSDQLLFWIEALSLLSIVDVGLSSIRSLQEFYQDEGDQSAEALEDIVRFMQKFSLLIRESAPHLYVSALPFVPHDSWMRRYHQHRYHNIITVKTGLAKIWSQWSHLITQNDSVYCVAYSPNGHRIVSGCRDRTIRIWHAETGAQIGDPLVGHSSLVRSVAYSPDGRRIVSGSRDETVRLWNAITGAQIGNPLTGHSDSVTSVAFSPNSRRIVSGSYDRTIRVWDADTGAQIGEPLTGHSHSVTSVAYSPDSLRIISGSHDGTVRVWNAEIGTQIKKIIAGHSSRVTSVAFSPDSLRIVCGSKDKTVRVWNSETGAQIGDPFAVHSHAVFSVAYSPDGLRIISGSYDKTVRVWDAETGAQIGEPFVGHLNSVKSVAYSSDGRRIVSGSLDKTVRVWKAETGAQVGHLLSGHTSRVTSVAYSPDGCRIVSGSKDTTVRVWDADTGAQIGGHFAGHLSRVTYVAFSPDGCCVVSGSDDNTLRVWNAATGAQIGEPFAGHSQSVTSVAYSPDGRRIASGSRDRTVRIWNAYTGAQLIEPFAGHLSGVTSVAFSPDGDRIVSGSDDETIRVWNVAEGVQIGDPFSGHSSLVTSVAFSPDGRRIVSGSRDNTLRMWDVETGVQIGDPFVGHSHLLNPRGTRKTDLRVYKERMQAPSIVLSTLRYAHLLRDYIQPQLQQHPVTSVAYSPDGRRVVSCSWDKTVRIWNVETGAQIGDPVAGHSSAVASAAYSPDGRRIVSGSHDGTVRVSEVDMPFYLDRLLKQIARSSAAMPPSSKLPSFDLNTRKSPGAIPSGPVPREIFRVNTSQLHKYCSPDGWVSTAPDELLFWLPPEYQRPEPDDSWFVTSSNHISQPVWLDLSNFRHGTNWADVCTPQINND